MEYSICSYSFHRSFDAGQMDIFDYIDWCRETGFTQLDPWNRHLQEGVEDEGFLARVKAAAEKASLPFGCIAVDGAHIYEPSPEARQERRQNAYRWLEIAGYLGASQVRIDAGGPEEMPDDVFAVIVEGYNDIIARARQAGIEIVVENHWGPTRHPENVVKLVEAVDGLGLLFDTNNWAPGSRERAWEMCAPYARLTHIKTFEFDEQGNDPTVDIPKAMRILLDAGYRGTWGIESVPRDDNEIEGARKTLALMKRVLAE